MRKHTFLMSGKLLVAAAVVALSVPACVSSKKYKALASDKAEVERQRTVCQDSLLQANARIRNLSDANKRLGEMSAAEKERLSRDLAERDESLRNTRGKVDQLSGDLKSKEQRLAELEKALAEKDAAVNRLRTTVANALLGFRDSDLTVDIRNGKVYVSLAEQLLFKSGSTKVDPKGQEALQKLAGVLKQQQDVNVVVEGHTDDVPIAKGTVGMQDNWDLSVLRATEITRILRKAGVPGERITPSGRSEFVPVAQGKTPEIRQKNRRTEIILTPKLDELFQILEKN